MGERNAEVSSRGTLLFLHVTKIFEETAFEVVLKDSIM